MTELSYINFYDIYEGNQNEIIFAPSFDTEWFQMLDAKYSWDNFNMYDNRLWEYMYKFHDTLSSLAKGQFSSDKDFFEKLTRCQKIFNSFLIFNGEVDNGGVYQFFFNRPEFCFAIVDSLEILGLNDLKNDYSKCLDEFLSEANSFNRRKVIFLNKNYYWAKRWDSFTEGYSDIKSAETIENYFYKEEYKKLMYKTVVDYIDNHIESFVSK